MIIERKVRFGQGGRGRKKAREVGGSETPTRRVPRVARLMALAIRFDQLIRDGVVADEAELARVGHVSRASLTQIMNLLLLAPDIQEELLFLRATERGRNLRRFLPRPQLAEAWACISNPLGGAPSSPIGWRP